MKEFSVSNASINQTAVATAPVSIGSLNGSPFVSANGTNNGIVWVLNNNSGNSGSSGALYAFNALNISQMLWNSTQAGARDSTGPAVQDDHADRCRRQGVCRRAIHAFGLWRGLLPDAARHRPQRRRVHQFHPGGHQQHQSRRPGLLHDRWQHADDQFHALHRAVYRHQHGECAGHCRGSRFREQRRGQREFRQQPELSAAAVADQRHRRGGLDRQRDIFPTAFSS